MARGCIWLFESPRWKAIQLIRHGAALSVRFGRVVEENLNNMNTKQRGITGLETVIIMLAFVVVASVFALKVSSTCVFSSESAKETIFAGLEQTKSSLRPSGSVIAFKGFVGSTEAILKISMVVESVGGSDPIDLTPPYTSDGSGTDLDSSVTITKATIV